MGDDNHRQALFGEVAHDFEHFADHLGVECARRLVEQQNFGLHRKRAGYCDALLLTAGELGGLGVDVGCHADLFKIMQCGSLGFGSGLLENLRLTDHAVLESGHVVEKIERLEHHADVRTVCARAAFDIVDVCAVIEYLAGGRSLKEVYAAEQS